MLDVARAHGLDVRVEDTDDTGWDFLVTHSVDADGVRWVLRQPRRPAVSGRIPVEARLLELLKPRLPVAVPDWEVCTPELVAYRRLAGTPLAAEDPATLAYTWECDPPDEFFGKLGETLAILHRIALADVEPTGLEMHDGTKLRAEIDADLRRGTNELGIASALRDRWRQWIDDDRYWSADVTITHGDLSPNHTLVDERGALLGILDWTDAEVQDPAVDFAAPCLAFGAPGLDQLLHGYAAAGGHVREHFREHILELTAFRFSVQFGLYSLEINHADYLAIAQHRLGA